MVISPFGFTRLSFATLPCRYTELGLSMYDSAIANPLMSVLFGLDASIAKLTLRLVVHRASVFMLLTLLMIQL